MRIERNVEPIPGYRLNQYLGRGGFGEVWEAEAPGGLSKAIKLAPMEDNERTLNSRELEGLQKIRSIRHPYLLSIERFEVREGYLIIVMELADQNLAQRFDQCVREGHAGIPRAELLKYLAEAAEVLDVMNQQHGLQHLDIKPENLFLCGGHVKVADFGLVQPRNTSMSRSALAISPPYAAPELFDGYVEPTADQYSLAVTYQELLTGSRPFHGSDVRALIFQHLRGKADLSSLPPADRPLISRSLQRDPTQRFSNCTELIEALSRAAAFGAPDLEIPKSARRPELAKGPLKTRRIKPRALPPAQIDQRDDVGTRAVGGRTTRIESLDEMPVLRADEAHDNEVRATFVAFLPLEIFAHKLRGFIDALGAEIMNCTNEKTVLRFSPKNWLGMRSHRGIYLEIDTCVKTPQNGHRVVDVRVWSNRKGYTGQELARRGVLLILCLRSYLMATDKDYRLTRPDVEILREVLA